MCRIAGIHTVINNGVNNNDIIREMASTLAHGGPDASGYYVDGNIALGHRRLSIIDLTAAGNQPMYWQQYVMVFNGEIYNYKAIRHELEELGQVFSSGSDTEVLLRGWSVWGQSVLDRCRGMFAFAIWDNTEKKLTLCRDRMGVKPLYYYSKDGLFMFASEIKAFHQHPDFDRTINQGIVGQFLRQGYIQSPKSIYKFVQKVSPGYFLEVDLEGQISTYPYWEAKTYLNSRINLTDSEVLEKTEYLIQESCDLRMVADVPVGLFLSGGTDSSLVTSLVQKNRLSKIKTFTIGFQDAVFNEATFAKKIAEHLGTDHHELYCTEYDFIELIDLLPYLYDEPLGAESALPTYLISQLAKKHVKVSLSADGGDELFGGYSKYEFTKKYYSFFNVFHPVIRQSIGKVLRFSQSEALNNLQNWPFLSHYSQIAQKLPKLRRALQANSLEDFFYEASTYASADEIENLFEIKPASYQIAPIDHEETYLLSYLGLLDIESYLEGEILSKVDRATMHNALEGRDPLLDHHLVEFALAIPDNQKMKYGIPKYLLKTILKKYLPENLTDRPKQGFSVPIYKWLQGILRNEVTSMANNVQFHHFFGLNSNKIQETIKLFQLEIQNTHPKLIWNLLMLYKWYNRWAK